MIGPWRRWIGAKCATCGFWFPNTWKYFILGLWVPSTPFQKGQAPSSHMPIFNYESRIDLSILFRRQGFHNYPIRSLRYPHCLAASELNAWTLLYFSLVLHVCSKRAVTWLVFSYLFLLPPDAIAYHSQSSHILEEHKVPLEHPTPKYNGLLPDVTPAHLGT